jgi:hypothetical protein
MLNYSFLYIIDFLKHICTCLYIFFHPVLKENSPCIDLKCFVVSTTNRSYCQINYHIFLIINPQSNYKKTKDNICLTEQQKTTFVLQNTKRQHLSYRTTKDNICLTEQQKQLVLCISDPIN